MTDKQQHQPISAAFSDSNRSRPPDVAATWKSSWLHTNITDLEEKMKKLVLISPEEDKGAGDTFAERAESYYRQRPQLLSLLYELHNAYLSLADRYSQTLKQRQLQRHHRRSSSQVSTVTLDHDGEIDDSADFSRIADSDAESSISYQNSGAQFGQQLDSDAVIAELVMKCVELDIAVDGMGEAEKRSGESGRKIELQRSLLEVLEAERMVLLKENAMLGYRADATAAENDALASEVVALKRRAGELARCVLRMREDQRVCLLGRKIEDLQQQIRGLEMKNKEYCEMLVKGTEKSQSRRKKSKSYGGGGAVAWDDKITCFQREKAAQSYGFGSGGGSGKVTRWWEKVRKSLDVFQCVPRPDFA